MNHIQIKDKETCCGCSACMQICPKQCISMRCDEFGFAYPVVDESICINCGACLRVCPFITQWHPIDIMACYAAVNSDEERRLKSSSGGVFVQLAQRVLKEKGIVFGACFTRDWLVEHRRTEDMDGVTAMMGSKYVQSTIGRTYKEAERFLRADRTVLFTGTPCQIAGLRHYLKKDYPKLIAVEVVCHGVPSSDFWKDYLYYVSKGKRVSAVSFRDKSDGWRNYRTVISARNIASDCENKVIVNQPYSLNMFNRAFIRNFLLRPSCFDCKCKGGRSHADITIGDFWGIENTTLPPDNNGGVSCVICRSRKGEDFINECESLILQSCDYHDIIIGNPSIERSAVFSPLIERFRQLYLEKGFARAMAQMDHIPLKSRVKHSLKALLSKFMKL